MPYDDVMLEGEEKMEKAVDIMTEEFKGIRTGRASTALVDGIKVDYYGAPTPLKQLASITVPEPRMILIKPFDAGSLGNIEKAIQKSEIGINPQSDGKIIRLVVPPMSEDRRKQMAKLAKDAGEKAKTTLRNIRRDANMQIDKEEKSGSLTEDEKFKGKEEIQNLIKKYEDKVEDLVTKKTKEVMEV